MITYICLEKSSKHKIPVLNQRMEETLTQNRQGGCIKTVTGKHDLHTTGLDQFNLEIFYSAEFGLSRNKLEQ